MNFADTGNNNLFNHLNTNLKLQFKKKNLKL